MLSGIGGNAIPAFAPQTTSAAQNTGNLFAAIDSDGDGSISAAELSSFLSKMTANTANGQPPAVAASSGVSGASASSLIDQLRSQLATSAAVSAGSKAGAAASTAMALAAVNTSAPAASASATASAVNNRPASPALHHHHHHGASGGNGSARAPQLLLQYQQRGTSSAVNARCALSAIA